MLEWILIIAVIAAIFYAKDLPALKDKIVVLGEDLLKKAKEKKDLCEVLSTLVLIYQEKDLHLMKVAQTQLKKFLWIYTTKD